MAGLILWGTVPCAGSRSEARQRGISNANTKLSLVGVGAAVGTAAFIWLGCIVRPAEVQTEKGASMQNDKPARLAARWKHFLAERIFSSA
jgi:hypothetical protein